MELTIQEFAEAYGEWMELENERTIEGRRMARMVAFYSAAPHTKLRTFKQIMTLPGEQPTEHTVEELKKRNEEHRKRLENPAIQKQLRDLEQRQN
jgi:hypothetical protein